MLQTSCLAGHRLFARFCTLNTCKANRGANLTFMRAEWWGAECRWARTWEHTALCARSPDTPVSCQQGPYQPPVEAGSNFPGADRKVGPFSLPQWPVRKVLSCSSEAEDGEPSVQLLSLHSCPERQVLCSRMGWRQTLCHGVFQRTSWDIGSLWQLSGGSREAWGTCRCCL